MTGAPAATTTGSTTTGPVRAASYIAGSVVVASVVAAAFALGWVLLVLVVGADGWEGLVVFLRVGVALFALLAGLPHALVWWWARRPRRTAWPTLLAAFAATALFPAAGQMTFDEVPSLFSTVTALSVLFLVAEAGLVLYAHRRRG